MRFARRDSRLVLGCRAALERAADGWGTRRVRLALAALTAAGVLASSLALAAQAAAPTSATAADPVVIALNPSDADLWLCSGADCTDNGEGHLVLNEQVLNVPASAPISGFEFSLYFDPALLNVSVTEGPFLGSTGRLTTCQLHQMENSLLFGCTSTGSQPGPTGSGVLAYVTLTPRISIRPTLDNGVVTNLAHGGQTELTDQLGEPVPIDEVRGSTVLIRALEGDVNRDCHIDVIDEQSVSGRYGTTLGLWPYNVWFDLEPKFPDSDIDIKDVQFVFGRDGRSCEGPGPTPEPTATPSPTPGGPTATATPTATARTVTPGPTATATATSIATASPTATSPAGTATASPTATATSAAGTATPTRTPRTPHPTHTATPSPPAASATPGPTGTPAANLTPPPGSATATPQGQIEPTGRTPGPVRTISPAEVTPENLPGSGSGGEGQPSSGSWLLTAMVTPAILGCLVIIIGILSPWNSGLATSVLERVRSKARRPNRPRR